MYRTAWYPARCAKCLKRFVPKSRRSKVCQECRARAKKKAGPEKVFHF